MSKIKISLNGNFLELEGSDDFIKSNLELMQKIENATPTTPAMTESHSSDHHQKPKVVKLRDSLPDLYPNVYHPTAEGFDILSELPGKNNAVKTRNLAIMYLYGKKGIMDSDSADSNELRKLTEKFGCLDTKNFAKHLTATKPYLSVSGKKGGNKIYTITKPGEKEALKIVSEINKKESAESK